MKENTNRIKCKGFTLVEIIVVIAILGVLMAILVPSLLGYVRKARRTSDIATAKEIYNNVVQVISEDKKIQWSVGDHYYSSNAAESFYAKGGSSYKDIMNGRYKPQWYTKSDEEGNVYHLIPVATWGPRTDNKWKEIDAQQQSIAYYLNEEAAGITPKGLEIKYQPKGQDPELNTWFVCYRSNNTSMIEVWVGHWHSNDADYGGSGVPIYRVYPDPTY